jgi:hypothetical protein
MWQGIVAEACLSRRVDQTDGTASQPLEQLHRTRSGETLRHV